MRLGVGGGAKDMAARAIMACRADNRPVHQTRHPRPPPLSCVKEHKEEASAKAVHAMQRPSAAVCTDMPACAHAVTPTSPLARCPPTRRSRRSRCRGRTAAATQPPGPQTPAAAAPAAARYGDLLLSRSAGCACVRLPPPLPRRRPGRACWPGDPHHTRRHLPASRRSYRCA